MARPKKHTHYIADVGSMDYYYNARKRVAFKTCSMEKPEQIDPEGWYSGYTSPVYFDPSGLEDPYGRHLTGDGHSEGDKAFIHCWRSVRLLPLQDRKER